MDSSKQYKEMSKKAIKIQSIWVPHWGDFITDSSMDSLSVLMSVNFRKPYGRVNEFDKNDIIWLPRQDQLQEMMICDDFDITDIELMFHNFARENWSMITFNNTNELESMEQLWLAFVMKEKYLKQWSDDKKEWIKI